MLKPTNILIVNRPGRVNFSILIDNVTDLIRLHYVADIINVEFSDHQAVLICVDLGLINKVKNSMSIVHRYKSIQNIS